MYLWPKCFRLPVTSIKLPSRVGSWKGVRSVALPRSPLSVLLVYFASLSGGFQGHFRQPCRLTWAPKPDGSSSRKGWGLKWGMADQHRVLRGPYHVGVLVEAPEAP